MQHNAPKMSFDHFHPIHGHFLSRNLQIVHKSKLPKPAEFEIANKKKYPFGPTGLISLLQFLKNSNYEEINSYSCRKQILQRIAFSNRKEFVGNTLEQELEFPPFLNSYCVDHIVEMECDFKTQIENILDFHLS